MISGAILWAFYVFCWLLEIILLRIVLTSMVRKSVFTGLLFLIGVSTGLLLTIMPLFWLALLWLFTLYRCINLLRIPFERMHEKYLYNETRYTSNQMCILHCVLFIGYFMTIQITGIHGNSVHIVMLIDFVLITIGLTSLKNSLKTTRVRQLSLLGLSELPSITVAIPARNETQDLADCLQSFCNSRYEKLEIIVYDDCSHDRTSDIIKSFAHKGVRFIQGSEPGEVWLPKNTAYDKLAREANGEIILFCGVDVRVKPDTLIQLVSHMHSNSLKMISVLPSRATLAGSQSVVQLIRYVWELALPRHMLNRPAVLSTLWAIHKDTYTRLGGMESVKRMVVPESYFARELQKTNEYAFVRSSAEIDIQSTKTARDQRNTALRIRYPQLHKRPERVLSLVVIESIILVAPVLAAGLYFQTGNVLYIVWFVYLFLLPVVTMAMLVWTVTAEKRVRAFLQSLLAIPVDIFLANYSLYKYEFGDVTWKERNVCLPVMHVVPSLPKID